MTAIRTILVIVDPAANQHPAVVKAAVLAEKFSARLDLFVCDTKASRNIRQAEQARRAAALPLVDPKGRLESLAAPLRQRGLDVTTQAIAADPLHTALLDRVRHTCADLVIKDTHHHSLAQRTLLTNTDWELIRSCPVPLLLTKPKFWAGVPCICAAVDPGHDDDKPRLLDHCILDAASTFSTQLGGQLHVLHTYIPMAMVASAAGSTPPMMLDVSPELLASERAIKLRELTTLVSDYRVPANHIHLEIGGVSEVLCRLAGQLNADVMTMGAVSRSAVKRIFVGSTAESVLERLPCDALIVKGPNFAELLVL